MVEKEDTTMGNVFRKPEQREHWNKYNAAYAKKNYKSYALKLSKEKDKHIIDYLDSQHKSITQIVRELLNKELGVEE